MLLYSRKFQFQNTTPSQQCGRPTPCLLSRVTGIACVMVALAFQQFPFKCYSLEILSGKQMDICWNGDIFLCSKKSIFPEMFLGFISIYSYFDKNQVSFPHPIPPICLLFLPFSEKNPNMVDVHQSTVATSSTNAVHL